MTEINRFLLSHCSRILCYMQWNLFSTNTHVLAITRHIEVIKEDYIIALFLQVVLWCLSLERLAMKGKLTKGGKESGWVTGNQQSLWLLGNSWVKLVQSKKANTWPRAIHMSRGEGRKVFKKWQDKVMMQHGVVDEPRDQRNRKLSPGCATS